MSQERSAAIMYSLAESDPGVTPSIEELSHEVHVDPLFSSWARHLRAGNKSEATISAYLYAVTGLHSFLVLNMHLNIPTASVTREHIEAYIADQLATRSPATAHQRSLESRSATGAFPTAPAAARPPTT